MKKYINLILAAVFVVIFIMLMVFIKNGSIVNFDNSVYSVVTANTNNFLDNMFKVITFFASTKFIVGIVLVIFAFLFFVKKEKKLAFVIGGSVGFAALFNRIVKDIFRRERPTVRRLVEEKSFSFPSGHTNASVALCGILIFFIMRSKMKKSVKIPVCIALGIVPICVAISRIYLGAHFASDVIGAAVLTSAILFVETFFLNKYYDKIMK